MNHRQFYDAWYALAETLPGSIFPWNFSMDVTLLLYIESVLIGCLVRPRHGCSLGVSWNLLGFSGALGASGWVLGVSWVPPGWLLGALWVSPGSSGVSLGPWVPLGGSWVSPGCLLGGSWVCPSQCLCSSAVGVPRSVVSLRCRAGSLG